MGGDLQVNIFRIKAAASAKARRIFLKVML
ncbi:MAG: hypothetical protein PWQ54_1865 [Bacteroidales bacterium]|jgi:hypothetical protein|nr:hypothetical protein [Bacteroidales bacterium]